MAKRARAWRETRPQRSCTLSRLLSEVTEVVCMEFLSEYGLFLAKVATVVVAVAIVMTLIINLRQRKSQRGELKITRFNEHYKEMQEEMSVGLMDAHQQKQWHKAQKKKLKADAKAAKAQAKAGVSKDPVKPRVYVLDFKGSMDAGEVHGLREEITAVLSVAH